MADGVGLSVGATNLTAVLLGRAAVTRSAVVTLFPNRPLEVGVPGQNPRLNPDERGLVITDFVDRVGDPVGIVAADGSTHRGEVLLTEALVELLYEVTNGQGAADPVVVTYPAHWRPGTVDALRGAMSQVREFAATPLVSDAAAAIAALRDDPGLPTGGVIALCDFGGTGTSITVADAATGEALGQTVRYTELSGDLIDQAVLTHILAGLSEAGAVDVAGTSAIGQLSRLRGQCRAAKERLSTTAATSLLAELPGHRGEVRLTRNELDEAIAQPLDEFAGAVQETLDRSGARGLAVVASSGGGARIPLITTKLSEHFGVPVITTPQPELTSAIGGGLQAVRGTADLGATAMAQAVAPPTAAAAAVAATQMAPEVGADNMGSAGAAGLAWSEADDVPDVVAATDPYDYAGGGGNDAIGGARPQMQFEPETGQYEDQQRRRVPFGLLVAGLLALLLAIALAVWLVLRSNETTPAPSSTTVTTTPAAPQPTSAEPPPSSEAPPSQEAPPPVTQTVTQPEQTVTQTQEPPPPPSTSEAPPPTSEAPPPSSEAPPPSQQSSVPSTPPRVIPTLPYETIPGLPFVPRPIQPAP
ncbi:molecular chaperone [Mycolicibacterium moriokaense]|nr:molecular chaperone [Mycolicibacterium moriokaense]